MHEASLLLKKMRLHITGARRAILNHFLENQEALSISDIESKVDSDHSTIYRTLKTFLQHKIIQTIPNTGTEQLYALCENTVFEKKDTKQSEVYFQCNSCCKTFCMEDADVGYLRLPKGYSTNRTLINVQGLCDVCQTRHQYYRPAS
jgi:Fur family ferric uptake transcriptional regulator